MTLELNAQSFLPAVQGCVCWGEGSVEGVGCGACVLWGVMGCVQGWDEGTEGWEYRRSGRSLAGCCLGCVGRCVGRGLGVCEEVCGAMMQGSQRGCRTF